MKQMQLFNIEPKDQTGKNKQRPLFLGKKRTPKNKQRISHYLSLIDEMIVDVKKVPLLVCKQPKTIKMIPCDWTQEQKEAYIASHFDEKGRFKFEAAPDFTILSGQQNRR